MDTNFLQDAGALDTPGADAGDAMALARKKKELQQQLAARGIQMKKGGYVKSADGCCTKGKTKGKYI